MFTHEHIGLHHDECIEENGFFAQIAPGDSTNWKLADSKR